MTNSTLFNAPPKSYRVVHALGLQAKEHHFTLVEIVDEYTWRTLTPDNVERFIRPTLHLTNRLKKWWLKGDEPREGTPTNIRCCGVRSDTPHGLHYDWQFTQL